ncbi:MAG: membrane protein insertion efficiency factor YidD [Planctomycetota bacterium]
MEWFFIGIVRGYQTFISPLMPRTCRFYPSCSQYMIDALRRRGPIIGLCLGIWRVIRCNPLSEGGYDPVDQRHRDEDEA